MSTKERIVQLASEQLDIDFSEVGADTSLSELAIDSLDLVELIMAIEQEFGIGISDEEIEGITSIGAAVTLVESKARG